MKAFDTAADVDRYLEQPVRLNALLLQHSRNDDNLEPTRDLDELLTQKGITHEFDDSFIAHCSYDHYGPMLKFMSVVMNLGSSRSMKTRPIFESDHLVGEKVG